MDRDEFGNLVAPSLPPGILYPATVLLLLVLLFVLWRVKHRVARFLIFAAWFRYMASAYHVIMFKPSFVGISWNAVGSVAVFFLGLLLVRPRNLILKFLVPCYVAIAVVVISGLVNGNYSGVINVTAKYGYFVVVTLAAFEALEKFGERFMSVLIWAFTPPLLLQVLSIIFGISKATEADGSVSYIGGYSHEASFSVTLATCFVVACFASSLKPAVRNGILLMCLVGIFLADYRTTIVAIAPLVIAQFSFSITNSFRGNQKVVVGMGVLALSCIGVIVASWFLQQRFQDLSIVIESGGMIKPPSDFSEWDQKTMSGRPYIWSNYIYAYINGGTLRHLVGFGPESWAGVMSKYAHNTLVSYLYEYGALGVIVVTYFWLAMLVAAMRVRQGPKGKLLAAHVSFILLNMATMPLWMVEGNILYGIICGYTLYLLRRRSAYSNESWMRQVRRGSFAAARGSLRPARR